MREAPVGGAPADPRNRGKGGIHITRFFSLVASRWGKWIVLAVWIVIFALGGVYGNKLTGATKNEESSFLPTNAESTKELNLEKTFPGGQLAPALMVYHRESGLTAGDIAKINRDIRAVEALHLAHALPAQPQPAATCATSARPGPNDLVCSPNGRAAIWALPIKAIGDASYLSDDVKAIRDTIGRGTDGLQIRVTGGAGFTADAIDIFGNIDTTLLYAAAAVVIVLLLITYRSPILWLIPFLCVLMAEQAARAMAYGLTTAGVIVNGQTSGILTVLVFGAGTDYALLITARYREELRQHQDKHEAMALALRQAGPAILASGLTVAISLTALLVSESQANKGFGPISALGILLTIAAMLTVLPALLLVVGRVAFWPFVPRYGTESHQQTGVFGRLGARISRRPRIVWITTACVLAVMALGAFKTNTGLNQLNGFRGHFDSVEGQRLVAASFPAGLTAPTDVLVRPASKGRQAIAAALTTPGVKELAGRPQVHDGILKFSVALESDPYGGAARATIDRLRARVQAVAPATLVGGPTAVDVDSRRASVHDESLVIPLVLVVVFVILGILLRSIVAPVALIGTVILSFLAAFGVSIVAFDWVFHFAGIDPGLPLYGFIFLVALGVDYNIFLMARVREESVKHGTRTGTLIGLAATGGVITSAGLVLAGTFAALAVIPLVFLTEIGFMVAFGVLLDTTVVRSVLVPALSMDLDNRMWWPSHAARTPSAEAPPTRDLAARPS